MSNLRLFSDGFHSATMSTYEDPAITIQMYTDDYDWTLRAMFYDKQIDSIDLETVRAKYMERVISNTNGINIPVYLNYAGTITGTRPLQEYLSEVLDIAKVLDLPQWQNVDNP